MKRPPIPEPDLEALLNKAFRDDLPPETEARLNRHFLGLRRALDQPRISHPDRMPWMRWLFQKEILAFASACMLLFGAVLHLGGDQSVLAESVSRLKVMVEVSSSLRDATSMDCVVIQPGVGGEESRYRVRWGANGVTRVDRDTRDGVKQTLWISNTTMPPDPVWQPAMEFLMPSTLATNIENRYGSMQTGRRGGSGPDEFLLAGQENQQVIEIAVDERTFLPKMLKKYWPDSRRKGDERDCLMEVWFLWNQPIPQELLVPGSGRTQINH